MDRILLSLMFVLMVSVGGCSDPAGADESSCVDVDCSGFGSCTSLAGEATCVCDVGYRNDGPLVCVAAGNGP